MFAPGNTRKGPQVSTALRTAVSSEGGALFIYLRVLE